MHQHFFKMKENGMTSISFDRTYEICRVFDDSKTYPCYINGKFRELTPSAVRAIVENNLTIEERLSRIEHHLGIRGKM